MKTLYYMSLLFIIMSILSMGQNTKDSVILAKIEIEQTENSLLFKPTVQNLSPLHFEYNYLLLIKKTDSENNLSVNKQSGKFALQPNETKVLSTSQINQSATQNIKAYLYIRDEAANQLIAKDSIEIKKTNQAKVDETSLMIEGLVVDESKTKFGKEFYDAFFSVYNQFPKKFNFIILITELPFRGRTTIIQVNADQDLIHEFFTNPDEEYNKQQVAIALNNLATYAQNKQKITKEFNY